MDLYYTYLYLVLLNVFYVNEIRNQNTEIIKITVRNDINVI